jgi:hypothetical protein
MQKVKQIVSFLKIPSTDASFVSKQEALLFFNTPVVVKLLKETRLLHTKQKSRN